MSALVPLCALPCDCYSIIYIIVNIQLICICKILSFVCQIRFDLTVKTLLITENVINNSLILKFTAALIKITTFLKIKSGN